MNVLFSSYGLTYVVNLTSRTLQTLIYRADCQDYLIIIRP